MHAVKQGGNIKSMHTIQLLRGAQGSDVVVIPILQHIGLRDGRQFCEDIADALPHTRFAQAQ